MSVKWAGGDESMSEDMGTARRVVLVSTGLLTLVVLLLLGAFLLNTRLRPQVGTEDTLAESTATATAISAAAQPTSIPSPAESIPTFSIAPQAPTVAAPSAVASVPAIPTSTSANAAKPTNSPAVTTAGPTVTNTMKPSVSTSKAPTATPQPAATQVSIPPAASKATPSGINELPRRSEYERAYARYWEVLSLAYRTGDTTRLPEVLSGPLLDERTREIQALKQQGIGVALHIKTEYASVFNPTRSATDFRVRHRFTIANNQVDVRTGRALEGGEPPYATEQNILLVKIDGGWKVVSISYQSVVGGQ